jgi:integral membrane sensor domain MASE1
VPTDDDPRDTPDLDLVPVRRRPDLVRFLVTGAVIGGVIGAVIAYLGPDAPSSSLLQEVILLASTGALLAALLASVLYLLADRRSTGG